MKKISVIIPCYNVASYIDKCMVSITAQTIGMEFLEIICIDDASTDDTWAHLQRWENMFPNDILLIRQHVNRRQGAARNLGLQYASADWISFVDADDWIEFDYFQRLYDPVTRYRCDVVSCGSMRDMAELNDCYNENQRKPGKEYYLTVNTKELRETFLKYKLIGIGPAAKIIRKKMLFESEIFFPEELAYEDHYWVPLLYLYTTNAYIIEEKLYHYYWNPSSTTLMKNKDYHADCLTIQMMKWTDYEKRGLFKEYRELLEYDIIWYAMCFMSTIINYRDKAPFSFFQLEQKILMLQMPDYKNRIKQYVHYFSEKEKLILQVFCSSVTKKEFNQFVRKFKED